MFKIPLLRWRRWLPFALFFLCTGLNAQPIYNKKNVNVTAEIHHLSAPQTFRAMSYSTDPAGLNKEIRLEVLPENGFPAMMVYNDITNLKLNHFVDKAPFNYNFSDAAGPFPGSFGTSALRGFREVMLKMKQKFNWTGLDNTNQMPILINLTAAQEDFYAGYDSEEHCFLFNQDPADESKDRARTDIIAHEYMHAVVQKKANFKSNADLLLCHEFDPLKEAISDIWGIYMRWLIDPSPSNAVDWTFKKGLANNYRDFKNPKATNYPDTYFGALYSNDCSNNHDEHINCTIVDKWFSLMVDGSEGPKKNDHGTHYDCTGMGMETAIQIVWRATDKLTVFTDFKAFRDKTLEAAHELGHPVGSPIELIIRQAWEAVGLGNEFPLYNADCNSALGKGVVTWYNGVMPVNLLVSTVDANPQSAKVRMLVDCASNIEIATKIYNPEGLADFIDTDDADENYTLSNDLTLSNGGTTVHAIITHATEHFKTLHNHLGLDGNGGVKIINVVGTPTADFQPGFDKIKNQLNFDIDKKTLSADQIVGTYFEGMFQYSKNPPQVPTTDAAAIFLASKDIFGLEVNNELRVAVNQEPVWTIGSDAFGGNDYLRSFADPASRGQLMFYGGQGWAGATALQKAGVPLLWYYLMSNGSEPVKGFTNELNKTYHILKLDQIQERLAEKVVFNALKLLSSNPTFDEFILATQTALMGMGHSQNSAAYKTMMRSWEAVTGNDYLKKPEFGIVYEDDNAVSVHPWKPVQVFAEIEYSGLEGDRLYEASTDPSFNEQVAPVYRAFQSSGKWLEPYIDKKNPGKAVYIAEFYLEENENYYLRSRLYTATGQDCAAFLGSDICRELEKQINNWGPTIPLITGSAAPLISSPSPGEEVDAWGNYLACSPVPGAEGYVFQIQDLKAAVGPIEFQVSPKGDDLDPENYQTQWVELGKEQEYSWQVRAFRKIGSPKGVTWDKTIKAFAVTGMTDVNTFGSWTPLATFKTSLPATPLRVPPGPADGEHVAPFGTKILLSAEELKTASGYRYHIQDKKDDMATPYVTIDHSNVKLDDVADGKVYTWAFEPYKEITPPFITGKEFGKKYFSTFVIDYSLIPKPTLTLPDNNAVFTFQSQGSHNFVWHSVAGADQYDYTVSRTFDDAVLGWAEGSTAQSSVVLDDVMDLPGEINGGFKWRVRAKVKDEKGEWIYGPYSNPSFYWLRPTKSNLFNPSEGIQLQEVDKVDFTWDNQWAPDGFLFRLFRNGEQIFEKPVKGTSITLTNLEWGKAYAWDAPAMNVTPIGTHFPEPYTFHHFSSKGGVNEGEKKVKEYDPNEPEEEEPADPNDPNDPNNPGQPEDPELGKCPGFFNLKVTNSQYLSFTLTSHAIGSFDKTYGFKDAGGQPFLVACANCTVTLDEAYMENDDVEIYVKILSLASEWQDIPAYPDDETPIITITDPFGIVIGTLKMTIFNWYEGKEIYLGRYTCSKYK